MTKYYKNGTELNAKLIKGIEKICEPVASTLGPGGKTVILQQKDRKPIITKDGVSIANFVDLEDPFENAGAQMIKQAAAKTNDECGDGPQPLYSKILTPSGFVEMASLKIGDKICGTDNTVQEVVGIYPKGLKRIYKMHFSNDRVVECCLDHLWNVITYYGKEKTVTVKQLLDSELKIKKTTEHSQYKYYTPITSVEFDDKHMELDPYLVGLLIGDGSLCTGGSIELSLSLHQDYILEKLKLPENIKYTYTKDLNKNYLRIKFSRKENQGPTMHEYVRRIGLLNKKSKDKFIPKQYLYSSYKNRLSLLGGLVESDGYVNKRGLIEYSTISNQLCSDFSELLRGLGKQVNIHLHKRKNNSFSNTPIYRISELNGDKYGIKLKHIEETNQYTEMMCIKVSNPDSLYITDDYIVTHNTTTTTVLAGAIIKNAQKYLIAGISPHEMKRGMEIACEKIIDYLAKNSKKISKLEDIKHVATISANGDKGIGELVSLAVDKAGRDGAISIEESRTSDTTVDLVEGFMFDSGYTANIFVTDEKRKAVKYENCLLLITDKKLTSIAETKNVLELAARENKPLVIIADDVDGEFHAALITNAVRGSMKVVSIRAPRFGEEKRSILSDLALATGGTFISREKYTSLDGFKLTDFGRAKVVDITKNMTTVVAGNSDYSKIEERIENLKEEIKNTDSLDECKKIQDRINRLVSGVVIIKVGASTQLEMLEKKHRIEDALEAVKTAQIGGIHEGGGMAFVGVYKALRRSTLKLAEQERLGYNVILESILEPLKQMSTNSGMSADVLLSKALKLKKEQGFDLKSGKVVNMFEKGIIDPTKVTCSALKNSVSVSSTILTANHAIIEN